MTAIDRHRRHRGGGGPAAPDGADDGAGGGGRFGPALLAILILIVLIGPIWHVPRNLYLPEGYTQLVDALSGRGLIEERVDSQLRPVGYHIATLPERNPLQPLLPGFVEASFLKGDMQTADDAIWNNGAIQPTAHRESGPTDDITPWTGDLLFRTLDDMTTPPAFLSDGTIDTRGSARLELLDALGNKVVLAIGNGPASACNRHIDIRNPGALAAGPCPAGGPSAHIDFLLEPPTLEHEGQGFYLFLIGDKPVIHFFGAAEAAIARLVKVNGAAINVPLGGDNSENSEHYVPLTNLGTTGAGLSRDITLDIGPRHYRIVASIPAVSRFRGDGSRFYAPGLENMAAPVVNRMDGKASVATTLIEELQSAGQRPLDPRDKDNAAMKALLRDNPGGFRVAAVMMDGLTGEIVAVPSFPILRTPADQNSDDTGASRLARRNSSFVNMPVGSTAKVPFATAIAQRYPELLQFKLNDQTKDFDCMIGWSFPDGSTQRTDAKGPVDFSRFLAISNNRYALSLMMLGTVETQRANQPFPLNEHARSGCLDEQKPGMQPTIGGKPLFPRPWAGPRNSAGKGEWDVDPAPALPRAAGSEWSGNLLRFFCVIDRDESGEASDTCHPDLWLGEPLLQAKSELMLDPIRLGMNRVQRLKQDYLMSILGGARSRWSIIRLAQSYSRVVTNRAVDARLTPRPQQAAGSLGIRPEVREAVLRGMRNIFTDCSGTAHSSSVANCPGTNDFGLSFDGKRLGEDIAGPGGSVFRFYAKTGTPKIVPNTGVNEGDQALIRFVRQPSCGFRAESLAAGKPPRLSVGAAQGGFAALRSAIEQVGVTRIACAPFRQYASALAEAILHAERDPETKVLPGGRLHLPPPRALGEPPSNDAPEGKVFSLVIVRTKDNRACTVSTMAVNYQAQVVSGSPATAYIGRLLKDDRVTTWLLRPGGACK